MKKVLLTLLVCVGIILSAQAQKFGYLNSNELLAMMPESIEMQEELQTYAKGLESQLSAMQAEYEKKVVEYQQNETSYTDVIKEDKIREIESIQQRVVEFQKNAQQSLSEKEAELYDQIKSRYDQQISPYYSAARIWTDAIIYPLETRTWISMGIEAANHSPIDKKFNMGLLQV